MWRTVADSLRSAGSVAARSPDGNTAELGCESAWAGGAPGRGSSSDFSGGIIARLVPGSRRQAVTRPFEVRILAPKIIGQRPNQRPFRNRNCSIDGTRALRSNLEQFNRRNFGRAGNHDLGLSSFSR